MILSLRCIWCNTSVDNFKENASGVRVGPTYRLGIHANQFSKNIKNNLALFLRCFYVVSGSLLDSSLFQYNIVYISHIYTHIHIYIYIYIYIITIYIYIYINDIYKYIYT